MKSDGSVLKYVFNFVMAALLGAILAGLLRSPYPLLAHALLAGLVASVTTYLLDRRRVKRVIQRTNVAKASVNAVYGKDNALQQGSVCHTESQVPCKVCGCLGAGRITSPADGKICLTCDEHRGKYVGSQKGPDALRPRPPQ